VRFFAFTPDFAKISARQLHKYEFFSKISNAKVCFCHSQLILCCFLDLGMFSLALLACLNRSGVIANLSFGAKIMAGVGLTGLKTQSP